MIVESLKRGHFTSLYLHFFRIPASDGALSNMLLGLVNETRVCELIDLGYSEREASGYERKMM